MTKDKKYDLDRFTISIKPDLFGKFRIYCEKNGFKMSTKISKLIIKELNNEDE